MKMKACVVLVMCALAVVTVSGINRKIANKCEIQCMKYAKYIYKPCRADCGLPEGEMDDCVYTCFGKAVTVKLNCEEACNSNGGKLFK